MPNLPLLLGHRGARATHSVPENTVASFDLALKHGCDGFEFDVRLAAGGRMLVCHDARVDGVTVSRATRKQLLNLPQLEDVLERYARKVFLDIEIKVKGLESKALAALRAHEPERNYVISSFIPEVLMELKARSATSPLGMICDKPAQLARWQKLPIEYVIPHESLVSRELIEEIHGAEQRVLAWTVNDKKAMLRFAEWGVDGLISDDTELLVRTFS
jgi:glycerophosphoryl diester phosphodiesterase